MNIIITLTALTLTWIAGISFYLVKILSLIN